MCVYYFFNYKFFLNLNFKDIVSGVYGLLIAYNFFITFLIFLMSILNVKFIDFLKTFYQFIKEHSILQNVGGEVTRGG